MQINGYEINSCPHLKNVQSGWIEPGSSANIPYAIADLNLDKDEFSLLVFFILKSHNPDAPRSSWWSYTRLQDKFKMSRVAIRRATFILQVAGLIWINKPPKHKDLSVSGKGRKNFYVYRHINPSEAHIFRQAVEWARVEYSAVYNPDGSRRK
ncbi:MAG TPA: hypothetical protein PK419_06000 [Spirochaetota bacterium]|jgi:hypothetical protein|nr:hypothetical protein [Spirochaetota bacterium]HOA06346.1 hypothetical protein [Spirochaetota bacterium]HOH36102.1 hypothetical protein [Spirochaetota bacterium]HOU83257.1 hypothetical protein [Spirochaetota bacterium]HPA64281.1 hypothetical protein [Spirochaetota bacterium]